MKTISLYISFLIISFSVAYGQTAQLGLNGSFLLKNYSPKEYNGDAQIFEIIQDDRGVMYFSNQQGVLEFDGKNWTTIPINKDQLKVLSINKSPHGLIHVGVSGDFGFLKPNKKGRLEFVSLLDSIGIDSIGRVSQILFYEGKEFLKTLKEVIVISHQGVEVYPVDSESLWVFYGNNKLFVLQKGLGLFSIEKTGMKLIKDGQQFANKVIVAVITFNNRKLIFTSQNGIFELTAKNELIQLSTLTDLNILSAVTINEKLISIGTVSDGIVVVDTNFVIVHTVGLEKGISDAAIKTQFIDNENNLWLGTNVGITKIDINSPVLTFDLTSGLRSGIQDITRYRNELYVASLDGVYKMNPKGKFIDIGGVDRDCYGLQNFSFSKDTLLFVAEVNSVITVDKNNNKKTLQTGGPYAFKRSPLNPNEIIVLHYDGIANLIYDDGKFRSGKYIHDFSLAESFNFIIQEDGTIWIGTLQDLNGGVYKTHVNVFRDSTIGFERFYTESGLPDGVSYLFEHDGKIYVGTEKGLYKYTDGKFKLFNGFGVDFTTPKGVHRIYEDSEGRIWMVLFEKDNNYEIGFSRLVEGKYVWESNVFTRYSEGVIHALYYDKGGVTWLGGPQGLSRYDSKIQNNYDIQYNTLIRMVKYGDSILFNGAFWNNQTISISQPEGLNFEIDYSSNKPITFSYSSTSFIDEKKTLYSIILEGHDDRWSSWTKRTMKEYYLSEGTYSFKVKAKNIYGVVTKEAIFRFVVLPPWYRTIEIYVLYLVAFLFFVYVSIRLSIRRVKQQNIKLEGIIDERTKEVVIQKQDAEKQRDIAERQKALVEQAHREITDSINYAERIQRSFLATDEVLNNNINDYFVFFQPKDVVSGDFYWAEKLSNGNFVMVNADSTGHGVPGAIMSILNISSIEKALEKGYTEPSEIFNFTRKTIIERLKKDGSPEGGKDGMDASIICFDFKNNKFTYTAAQNPIWVVRDGKLTEIKPEKMPVGKHDKDQTPFVGGEFEIKKGDIIYTLTDGFQDQFGGPKGKKFMVKKMREYILSISHLPMKEQHIRISKVFVNWKGDTEQVDDVCVIGVKI